jgi:hypothetical protein
MKLRFTFVLLTCFFHFVAHSDPTLSNRHNAFTILGLTRSASLEDIRIAYRVHKIRFTEFCNLELNRKTDFEAFELVKLAYETLNSEEKLKAYQKQLDNTWKDNVAGVLLREITPWDYREFMRLRNEELTRGLLQSENEISNLLKQISVLNQQYQLVKSAYPKLFTLRSAVSEFDRTIQVSLESLLFTITTRLIDLEIPVHKVVEILLRDEFHFSRYAVSVMGYIYDRYPWSNYQEFRESRKKLDKLVSASVSGRNLRYFYGAFYLHKHQSIKKVFETFTFSELVETLAHVSGYRVFLSTLESGLTKAQSASDMILLFKMPHEPIPRHTGELEWAADFDFTEKEFEIKRLNLMLEHEKRFLGFSPSIEELGIWKNLKNRSHSISWVRKTTIKCGHFLLRTLKRFI